MSTIESDVLDIVGEALSGDLGLTTGMLDSIATNRARSIIMGLPEVVWGFLGIQQSAFAPSTGIDLDDKGTQIINVMRVDGSVDRPCVQIEASLAGAAAEVGSLHEATAFTPVFYIESGTSSAHKIKILPDGTSSLGKLTHVDYPAVDVDSDTFAALNGFPTELGDALKWGIIAEVKMREQGLMHRLSTDQIEAITSSGVLARLTSEYTDMTTAGNAARTILGGSDITDAITSADTAMEAVVDAIVLANDETDKVVAATTGPLDLANIEFDKISALLDKGEVDSESAVNTALTAIKSALGKVALVIVEGSSEIDAGSTEIDTLFDTTTSGIFARFNTAIADVQGDMDNAIKVLGSTSPDTNAVNALLVASAATTPADQDAIQMLSEKRLPDAQIAVSIAAQRINEAVSIVKAGTGKIAEAQAELANVQAHIAPTNLYFTNADSYFKEAASYLSEAQGFATEVQGHLSQAEAKRSEGASRAAAGGAFLNEGQARLASAQSYLAEAQMQRTAGDGHIKLLTAVLAHASGYLAEVQARAVKAQSLIAETGVRIQTTASYEAKGQAATVEADRYDKMSLREIALYTARFTPRAPEETRET